MNKQLIAVAVVCVKEGQQRKSYLSPNEIPKDLIPNETEICQKIKEICEETGLSLPNESVREERPSPNARGLSAVTRYGFKQFIDLYTSRQLLGLLIIAKWIKEANKELLLAGVKDLEVKAIITYLSFILTNLATFNSSFCVFDVNSGRVTRMFARHALPMVWDFAETNIINSKAASWFTVQSTICSGILSAINGNHAQVIRGTATSLPYDPGDFDAVITDPPYYDNVPYADLSDYFYVWLKRLIGHLYPEHFSTEFSPKKNKIILDSPRHGGTNEAKEFYEKMLFLSFKEAARVLKPQALLICMYAHKTTSGWSTLVNALHSAGFIVNQAWPIKTENLRRLIAVDATALSSSIFIVARKRGKEETGSYENDVYPQLQDIVKERVNTLFSHGITGADLVIACVGAGLRAYTQFEKVEYANGELVTSEGFLYIVEGLVLETILEKLFGISRKGVSDVDAPTRFYVLWRYTYGRVEVDSGEAIVFAYPQGVELDGPLGLSSGRNPLLEKKGNKYKLRDYSERGMDEKLGLENAPTIDVLHRVSWLLENQAYKIPEYIGQALPKHELLKLTAQALAGTTLGGSPDLIATTSDEKAVLSKLLANWKSIIGEDTLFRR